MCRQCTALRCLGTTTTMLLILRFEHPIERRLRPEILASIRKLWHDPRRRQTRKLCRVRSGDNHRTLLLTQRMRGLGMHRQQATILCTILTRPALIRAIAHPRFLAYAPTPSTARHRFFNPVHQASAIWGGRHTSSDSPHIAATFFSQHQQRRDFRLGQCLLRVQRKRRMRLLVRLTPLLQLFGKHTFATAILAHLRLAQRSDLQHHPKLVRTRPVGRFFPISRHHKPSRFGFSTPGIKCCCHNACVLRQLSD